MIVWLLSIALVSGNSNGSANCDAENPPFPLCSTFSNVSLVGQWSQGNCANYTGVTRATTLSLGLVSPSTSYAVGDPVPVQLVSQGGPLVYKGITLYCVDGLKRLLGHWDPSGPDYKNNTYCIGNGITHTSATLKNRSMFTWKPDDAYPSVWCKAIVLAADNTWYVNITTQLFTVRAPPPTTVPSGSTCDCSTKGFSPNPAPSENIAYVCKCGAVNTTCPNDTTKKCDDSIDSTTIIIVVVVLVVVGICAVGACRYYKVCQKKQQPTGLNRLQEPAHSSAAGTAPSTFIARASGSVEVTRVTAVQSHVVIPTAGNTEALSLSAQVNPAEVQRLAQAEQAAAGAAKIAAVMDGDKPKELNPILAGTGLSLKSKTTDEKVYQDSYANVPVIDKRSRESASVQAAPAGPGPEVIATGFHSGKTEYKVIKVLGQGHFGRAYLVTGTGANSKLSVLKAQYCDIDSKRNETFGEATSMAKMTGGPNILKFEDLFIQGMYVCIVMNYCSGGSLADEVYKSNPPQEVIRIAKELCTGLAALHEKNIIHRDIKPDNIFLSDPITRMVIIGDLGMARDLADNEFYASTFGHTLYKAPEIQHSKFSSKSDMWAVGCTLLELLSHRSMTDHWKDPQIKLVLGTLQEVDLRRKVESLLAPVAHEPVCYLVRNLLVVDYNKRLTAEQVIAWTESPAAKGQGLKPEAEPRPTRLSQGGPDGVDG